MTESPFADLPKKIITAYVVSIMEDLERLKRHIPSYRFEVKTVQPMRKKGQVAQWKREGHGYR